MSKEAKTEKKAKESEAKGGAAKEAEAEAAKPKGSKSGKPKQAQLSGMEDKRDEKLTELAIEYRDARNHRMEVGKEETKAHEKLLEYMDANGIEIYRDIEADLIASVEAVERKVRVKTLQTES